MEETNVAKATMTAGIVLGVTGAVAGTPMGNALSGVGIIMIALSILLFPEVLVEIILDYVGGDYGVPDKKEGPSDR